MAIAPPPGVVIYVWNHYITTKDGKPLIGGKLHTFNANTTTPKSAYHDPFLISPQTNPIILNDQGAADIHLDGFYRLVQEDADGVVLWDIDSFSFASGSPPPLPGDIVTGMTESTVSSVNGAAVLQVTGAVPTGYRVEGCIVRIDTAFGAANGLQTIAIGDSILEDAWGTIGVAAGLTTIQRDFHRADRPIAATAYTILLSAQGGLFNGAGTATLRTFWSSIAGWT